MCIRDRYFRGPVLSNFDGQRWQPLELLAPTGAAEAALRVEGPGISYQVTLEPNQQPWLLTLSLIHI